MGWIRDSIEAVRRIHELKKLGIRGKIILMTEEEYNGGLNWQKHQAADIRNLNECVVGMIHGASACGYCGDKGECECHPQGCDNWYLRWPSEQELNGGAYAEDDRTS